MKWHKQPTLAGNPQGRRHYDIGGDDGSNIALVYPSEEDHDGETALREGQPNRRRSRNDRRAQGIDSDSRKATRD